MRPRAGERYTITAIRMSLTRPVAERSIWRFGEGPGSATLIVGPGEQAVLRLGRSTR